MSRDELIKQGLMLSEEDVNKFAHGYASIIPRAQEETDFKQELVAAYLAGAELIVDFYLEHM